MRKRKYPKYWSMWFGKFAIRVSGNSEPNVVNIKGVNSWGLLTGSIPNSPIMLLCKPSQLVEYTPRLYTQLKCNHKYKEHLKQSEIWKNRAIKGKI